MANKKNTIELLKDKLYRTYYFGGAIIGYVLIVGSIDGTFLSKRTIVGETWWGFPGLLALIGLGLYLSSRGKILCPNCNGDIEKITCRSGIKALNNIHFCPYCSYDLLEETK